MKIKRLVLFSFLLLIILFFGFLYKDAIREVKIIGDVRKINNIDKLKDINKNTISYIRIKGTKVNYPIVKYKDNDYYLKHSFDNSKNKYGWIFMDYRNEAFNNQNTIIYGHAMKNKTMFGSIKDMFKSSWLDNYKHEIKVYDNNEFVTYKIFSIYETEAVNDYLHTNFTSEEYKEFINTIIKKSYYDFNTEVNEDSKIITLSTCSRQNKRLVVHAIRV